MSGGEEMYVGYEAKAPPGIARFVRRAVVIVLVLAAGLAVTLPALQKRFDPGIFEFLEPKEFRGIVREAPYPTLEVDRPGDGVSLYRLVEEGKRGAAGSVRGLDGRQVELSATLVYRDDETILELVPGSVRPGADGDRAPLQSQALGTHTLVGEIVDSKCFLGVMKPGREKPHRACARLCIAGGIPPMLYVESRAGDYRLLLLEDADGQPVGRAVLPFVGLPVEITGRIERQGERLRLLADPATYRRR